MAVEALRRLRRLALVSLLAAGCCCDDPPPPPEPGGLPSKFNWRDEAGALPPVGDQGESEACVGWAVGYGATTFRLKHYLHPGWDLTKAERRISAAYLYNLALQQLAGTKVGEVVSEPQTLNFVNAFDVMTEHGIATEKTMPWTVQYDRHATAAAMGEASALRPDVACVTQWSSMSLSTARADDWKAVKESIVNVGPVLFMISVFADFECGVGSDYVVSSTNHHYRGKHAILCVGYDDNHVRASDGIVVPSFQLMNSWGTSWGDAGFIWMPYDVLVSSSGMSEILMEVYTAPEPPSTCPVPAAPVLDFPDEWKTNPEAAVWPAEVYDQCGAAVPSPTATSSDVIDLPHDQDKIIVRGPRVPLVPSLLNAVTEVRDLTEPTTQQQGTYTISAPQTAKQTVGAWIEIVEVKVLDRQNAPNPIVLRISAERHLPKPIASKKITIRIQ